MQSLLTASGIVQLWEMDDFGWQTFIGSAVSNEENETLADGKFA